MTEAAQVKIDTRISSDMRAEPPTARWASVRKENTSFTKEMKRIIIKQMSYQGALICFTSLALAPSKELTDSPFIIYSFYYLICWVFQY